ncbi:MAG: response regulator [Thermomicrobia bacterium]|nr:response regulator [Thermomicrobia bacterium]
MARHGIALVDDDPHIVMLLDDLFSEEGYRTLAISAGADAYTTIAREQPDLVILDLWMEQQDTGWTIYDRLRADDATARIPVVICSADVGTLRERTAEIAAWGDAMIEKPFDIEALLALVSGLLGNSSPLAPLHRR